MTQIETVQTLAKAHPITWRRATKEQRRQIVARFEATNSIRKAFAAIKAYRVELSDLSFNGLRRGGGR